MSKTLKLPSYLLDSNFVYKMATLLLPAFKHADEQRLEFRQFKTFQAVFNTSVEELRNQFFSDPLTKYLWSEIFIVQRPEICSVILNRIRKQENGKLKYNRLSNDMLCNEMNFGFKMIPDIARNQEHEAITNDALDAYNDLEDNGAYIEFDIDDSKSQTSN